MPRIADALLQETEFTSEPKVIPTYISPLSKLVNSQPATEAIDFQINGNYSKELVACLEEAMTMRDSYVEEVLSFNPNITRVNLVRRVHDAMVTYTNNTLVPQLKTIISKNTGITLSKVIEYTSLDNTSTLPSMLFAIDISFDNALRTIESIAETITGDNTNNKATAKKDLKAVYKEIEDTWSPDNLRLKKLNAAVVQKVFKTLNLNTTMYFDAKTAFLAHFYVSEKEAIAPMTAREIAAIITHEVGHVHTLVERIADDFWRKKSTHTTLRAYMDSKPSLQGKLSVLSELRAMYKTSKNSKSAAAKDNPEAAEALDKAMALVDVISDNASRFDGSEVTTDENYSGKSTKGGFWYGVLDFILIALDGLAMQIFWLNYVIFYVVFELSALVNLYSLTSNRDGKHGDIHNSAINKYGLETWADEFAVRLGFGGDLNSAFAKMEVVARLHNERLLISTDARLGGWKDTWLGFLTAKMKWAMLSGLSSGHTRYGYLGHEYTPDRVRTIERQMIDFFKANRNKPGLEPVMDLMIADMEKAIKNARKLNEDLPMFYKLVNLMQDVVKLFTCPSNMIGQVFDVVSKSRYYEDVYKALRTTENNKVFFSKAKLDQIARNA